VANHIALTPVPWYIGPGERGDGPMMQEPRGGIRAVKLTPEQRDYWIVAMTQLAKDGEGRTLHKALTALVTSESYKNQSTGPGGGREARIKLLYNTYRDLGAKMLLRHPQSTVLQRVQEVEEDKVRRLLPRTDPRSPQYGKPVKLGVPLSLGP
jgi:hypothetical protein